MRQKKKPTQNRWTDDSFPARITNVISWDGDATLKDISHVISHIMPSAFYEFKMCRNG